MVAGAGFSPSSSSFWDPVVDHINANTKARATDIVVVGHSLGGGLAKIVAAITDLPAFSMSGPGLFYTRCVVVAVSVRLCVCDALAASLPDPRRGKADLTLRTLDGHVTNVVPRNDIIPKIDRQTGLIQQVECDAESARLCHSSSRTIMTLVRACGDPHGRGIRVT